MKAIAPQLSHNTKKAFRIAKKMCKRDQAKKGEVLTTADLSIANKLSEKNFVV